MFKFITLRTKLFVVVVVPLLVLGCILSIAVLQVQSSGNDAAEQVKRVDQALAIERLADSLRSELAASLDPDGTPESLEQARSATDIRWVKVFDFIGEADRNELDLSQAELLRVRKGLGDDPRVVHDRLAAEILGQSPEAPVTPLSDEAFPSLIDETVKLEALQVASFPNSEIAMDLGLLRDLALWQDALFAEKQAFELYLQPDVPDEVRRIGLLGPSAAAVQAEQQLFSLVPVGRQDIADRLAANSAANELEQIRLTARSEAVEAREGLVPTVTAASDELLVVIAAEHRSLEENVVDATNAHLAETRELQRYVVVGSVGLMVALTLLPLLFTRSILREVNWLELHRREPFLGLVPSASSHGTMPIESAETDAEIRSMPGTQILSNDLKLGNEPDLIAGDDAFPSDATTASAAVPESLRAPVARRSEEKGMPALSTAVPASAEVEIFDPDVARAVPEDMSAVSDDSPVRDEISAAETLTRHSAGSGVHRDLPPEVERVPAEQFAAEFAAASLDVPLLPETVTFAPLHHQPNPQWPNLPEAGDGLPDDPPEPMHSRALSTLDEHSGGLDSPRQLSILPTFAGVPEALSTPSGPEAAPLEGSGSSDPSDSSTLTEADEADDLPPPIDSILSNAEADVPDDLPPPIDSTSFGATPDGAQVSSTSSDSNVPVAQAAVAQELSTPIAPAAEVEGTARPPALSPPNNTATAAPSDDGNQWSADDTTAASILAIEAAFASFERRSKPYDQAAFLDDEELQVLANQRS